MALKFEVMTMVRLFELFVVVLQRDITELHSASGRREGELSSAEKAYFDITKGARYCECP